MTRRLALLHLGVGAVTLAAFLITGAYMRLREPPVRELDLAVRLMFRSRHIYILGAALVHLALGAYVTAAATRALVTVQHFGSVLLVLASVLLVTAFVTEPTVATQATNASRFGLYGLLAGALLHTIAGVAERRGA